MKIGGNNDFQFKKLHEGQNVNPFEQNNDKGTPDASSLNKTGDVKPSEGVKSKSLEEGASSTGGGHKPPQQMLDKSQFTNENDIQEVDLNEFEDDF